jgi:hypothetical protein
MPDRKKYKLKHIDAQPLIINIKIPGGSKFVFKGQSHEILCTCFNGVCFVEYLQYPRYLFKTVTEL